MKQFYIVLFFIFSFGFFSGNQSTENQQLIENAKKYKPTEEARQAILKEVEEENENFNPEYNALKEYRPETANRYHSTMVGIYVHPTRTTAEYAVNLLATEIPEYQEKAFKVIEAVLQAQDQDSTNETYGIWPYNFEEPLEEMNKPDWNWADFIGVSLLEAYMQYHDVLPDDLKKDLEASILHASRSIKKRDVKPGYTNIAIMGTLVTHLAGHLFDDQDLKDYADMRMKRFYDYTKELGGFEEYNSPTYTRVALDELQRMRQYILDPVTLEMVNFCYDTGWKVLANHFHPPTGQLSGPHSRSYSTLIRERFYNILYGASDGKINYDDAEMPTDYYKLQHKIPAGLVDNFIELEEQRIQIDTFSLNDNPPVGYSYLTPDYAIGTINRATTWQQRRPYLVYWGDTSNTNYLRVRLLHDFEDFGIGNIFSVQNKNEVITALNFATNGGDYHINIDRIKDGQFTAEDVRLRFEIADKNLLGQVSATSEGFSIKDKDVQLTISMLNAVFGNHVIKAEKGNDEELAWVDYIIYAGEARDFDLTAINEANIIWHSVVQGTNDIEEIKKPELTRENNRISAGNDKISISIPEKPAMENELQESFSVNYHYSYPLTIEIKDVNGPEWSKGLPVYQVFLQRHTPEGTFNAFRERLSELKKSGVGILWFMPIHPMGELLPNNKNPFRIKDHFGIAPELGTKEDLKNLITAIHDLDMYVILGVVPNHTAYDNPLIKQHPEYYKHREDGSIAHVGPWESIAQLDYSNPEVQQYGVSYLKYWTEEFNFDGFRCDVAELIPESFWKMAIPELKKIRPDLFFLSESAHKPHLEIFDMIYDWTMQPYIWKIFWNEWPAKRLDSLLINEKPYLEQGGLIMRHMDNHDVHNAGYAYPNHRIVPLEKLKETNLYEKYGEGLEVANLLYATLPGKYMIYNGQEINYKESLPHNTIPDRWIEWKDTPITDFYEALFDLHRNPAIYQGDFIKLTTNNDQHIYAFLREQEENKVIIIGNLSDKDQKVQIKSSLPDGKWNDYFKRKDIDNISEVELNKYGYKVFIKNETGF